MSVIDVIKFSIGFTIGVTALVGAVGSAGYYFFIDRVAARPNKPVFAEEKDGSWQRRSLARPTPSPTASSLRSSSSPTPQPTASIRELPPGAYLARIVPERGVRFKKEPNADSPTAGGGTNGARIFVLKSTPDKKWLFVSDEKDEKNTGWILAPYAEKVSGN